MWSIDIESGHCAHASGLHVHFDDNLTPTGGLRCIGPYGGPRNSLSRDVVLRQLVDLSDKLEEQFCEETPYVIWGVLSDVPLVESLALKLEERTFGFIPNWSMRTESVFASNNESRELMRLLSREWADEPGRDRVKHKSGLVFEFVCIGGDSSSSAPLFVPRVRAEDGDHLLQESTVYQMCASALSPFAFRVFVANSDWPIASVCDHRAIDYRGPARLSSAR